MKSRLSTALLLPLAAFDDVSPAPIEMSLEEYQALAKPAQKRNKFNAQPTWVDGIRFASGGEARRYSQLKVLQQAGEISDLELQVKFKLVVNGILITTYICDYRYVQDGKTIVEDHKGVRTRVYIMKSRLMKAIHGITILETGRKRGRRRTAIKHKRGAVGVATRDLSR